jgi:hypothetical protein
MYRGKYWGLSCLALPVVLTIAIGRFSSGEPQQIPAQPLDPSGAIGERPYEMVLANRQPVRKPLVSFDSLSGWTLECENGAVGRLITSRKQQLWDSPVAQLVYRGNSDTSRVTLRPPEPIPLPSPISAATVWIYGNNWDWVPDPKTPQVPVSLVIRDAGGSLHEIPITRVRWEEWWLVHHVLPPDLLAGAPLRLEGIRVDGCKNSEDREIFFEDLAFFQEDFKPLAFAPRPSRGLALFPGQSAGANVGPGRLPFPTRETTILPENGEPEFETRLVSSSQESRFSLIYQGRDARIEYLLAPGDRYWGAVQVQLNGASIGKVMVGAGPVFSTEPEDLHLNRAWPEGDVVRAEWVGRVAGNQVSVESAIRLLQKSLVVDFTCRGGQAQELSYGKISDVEQPTLISMPFLNYGGHHLKVLMSGGASPFFSSVWMDWYRSNSSEPYATDEIQGNSVALNGGVRYLPKTDGSRNDLFERFFVTFSPRFEETLPTIPNPPAKDGKVAGSRLWQETWGPKDYEAEKQRSRKLREYGIEMLTQCNHEIAWRDGGESFTFRTISAPGKGGDEALKDFVAAQKKLGWRSGLYTNYTDYAPVNANWDIDMVMRKSSGELVTAWPRCYSPKALFAVEMDRRLAALIQQKFGSDAAYTDVHTAVSPWSRTDYDARVPGAGTFAATFYAYGELLLHDQEVYDHHCWSEGNHQWLYAGLTTGNYGLTYGEMDYREYPYLPHFDLLKIHPLSVDIGIPWTAQFFRNDKGWDSPERIAGSIDQFLAATIAYGHMAWLVEETHGIRQAARSYYMMQQLQSRYAMEKAQVIEYGGSDGLITSSEALRTGQWKDSRLHIRYQNGLEIWVNGNKEDSWAVREGDREHLLPPFGWLAVQGSDFFESSSSINGHRVDRIASPDYLFLDGRGQETSFEGITTSGSVAVRMAAPGDGLSVTAIEGVESLTLSTPAGQFAWDDVRTQLARVAEASELSVSAFGPGRAELGTVKPVRRGESWVIQAVPDAIRYEVAITRW